MMCEGVSELLCSQFMISFLFRVGLARPTYCWVPGWAMQIQSAAESKIPGHVPGRRTPYLVQSQA